MAKHEDAFNPIMQSQIAGISETISNLTSSIDIFAMAKLQAAVIREVKSRLSSSIDIFAMANLQVAAISKAVTKLTNSIDIYAMAKLQAAVIREAKSRLSSSIDISAIASLQVESISGAFSNVMSSFDFSQIEVNNNETLIYNGHEYNKAELGAELASEIELLNNSETLKKLTIPEKLEELKKKLWLFFLIYAFFSFIAELPENLDSVNKNYIQPILSIFEKNNESVRTYIAYTIKEQTILREAANAKSRRLYCLDYDTKLKIIENIPRWIKVELIDEEGNIVIGWVAKVNVEIEEKIDITGVPTGTIEELIETDDTEETKDDKSTP